MSIPMKPLDAIKDVDSKSHMLYIRYLLSKCVPPDYIRKELARLSLSCPSNDSLCKYFQLYMYPLARKHKVNKYYDGYKSRLEGKKKLPAPIIVFEDPKAFENSKDRTEFLRFIRDMGLEYMWNPDIKKYYKEQDKVPKEKDGTYIVDLLYVARPAESILLYSRKYVVDRLLLEGVGCRRIAVYLKEKYQDVVGADELFIYARYFFNIRTTDIVELLDTLVEERDTLVNERDTICVPDNETYSIGELKPIQDGYNEKIKFLDNSISSLNSRQTDLTYLTNMHEVFDTRGIVQDIVTRGYNRFKQLDKANDRDVVKPLSDIAKVIYTGVEKLHQIEDNKAKASRVREEVSRDKSASEILLELYQEAYDQHINDALPEDSPNVEDLEYMEDIGELGEEIESSGKVSVILD